MKWNRVFTAALMLSVSTAMSRAEEAPGSGSPEEIFAVHDADGDGTFSESEKAVMKAAAETQRRERTAKYDFDGDGALNAQERAALRAELNAARVVAQTAKFAALDEDGSGGLSLLEFIAGAPLAMSAERSQAAFKRMDIDHDELVSWSEFIARPAPNSGLQSPAGRSPKGSGRSKGKASVASAW